MLFVTILHLCHLITTHFERTVIAIENRANNC